MITAPATLPCRAWSIVGVGTLFNFSDRTDGNVVRGVEAGNRGRGARDDLRFELQDVASQTDVDLSVAGSDWGRLLDEPDAADAERRWTVGSDERESSLIVGVGADRRAYHVDARLSERLTTPFYGHDAADATRLRKGARTEECEQEQ